MQAKDNVIPAFIIRILIVMAPTFIPTNIKDQNRRAMKIKLIFESGSLIGKHLSTAVNLFQSIANLNSNKIYDLSFIARCRKELGSIVETIDS